MGEGVVQVKAFVRNTSKVISGTPGQKGGACRMTFDPCGDVVIQIQGFSITITSKVILGFMSDLDLVKFDQRGQLRYLRERQFLHV